jgi:hypothetical protein
VNARTRISFLKGGKSRIENSHINRSNDLCEASCYLMGDPILQHRRSIDRDEVSHWNLFESKMFLSMF